MIPSHASLSVEAISSLLAAAERQRRLYRWILTAPIEELAGNAFFGVQDSMP